MKAAKRIVHPTDFSSSAEPAFDYALESAKRDGAELILVHVLEPVPPFADELYVARALALLEAAEESARRGLDRLLARAKAAGVTASDVIVQGTAADAIVGVANERDADHIVLGTHGRTAMRRLILGSVAQRVTALASCPVVTIRSP
jgi:nucleotide-binding universal stress UspA family protein